MTEQTLQIEGMTCGSCVARVDKALRAVPGVTDAAVNLTTGLARIHTSENGDPKLLTRAVANAGYSATVLQESSTGDAIRAVRQRSQSEQQRAQWRLIVAVLFGLPLVVQHLLMAVRITFSFPGGMLGEFTAATLVMVFAGYPFFIGAFRAAIHWAANMDLLVALGAGTAYVVSVIGTVLHYWGHMGMMHALHQYDAAAAIIMLVTIGKYLEGRAKRSANSAVAALAGQSGQTATRLRADNTPETIPAEAVALQDRIQILAHQTAPVDGEVLEGAGSLDQSVVTGESIPIELKPSDHVPGGATLVDGRIVIRATSTAGTSAVARVLRLVQQAQSSKTQIQSLADRVAGIFVPIVLLMAICTFAGWMFFTHNLSGAITAAVATVVIACPCAMGLATPTAITVATGRAARLGILFTQASSLETARTIDTVLFDKTGTLTTGHPEVIQIWTSENSPAAARRVLELAAGLEQFSEHPLALAILRKAADEGITPAMPAAFSSSPGGGVAGTIDNLKVIAGSMRWISTQEINDSAPPSSAIQELQTKGMTIVGIGVNGKLAGAIGLRDVLRSDAASTISILRKSGLHVGVISGDTETAVHGALAGIELDEWISNVRPDDERARIAALQATGRRVAFVGDGVNDAPALAVANLGIGMAAGTELARAAGQVVLMSNRLASVPQTLNLARATLKIIKQNLFWAFAYNVAAIPLAMFGILSPAVAAGAMMLSSLTVVCNALRLNWVRVEGPR